MRFPTVLLSGYLSFATCGTELNNYFVAASSFFIIENMKRPDTRQSAMSTVHTPQRGSLPQRRPGIDTR